MTFADKILSFYDGLPSRLPIPKGVELIYPFDEDGVRDAMGQFYRQYFNDQDNRIFIFGINPGRFGAGITGIPFTDPVILESQCGIKNDWDKKNELSSIFVYDFINAMGGADFFYSKFIISSVCPLGFLKDGKNYNYYDDQVLFKKLEPFIFESIQKQLDIFCDRRVAFSLGKGKNYRVFKDMNDKKGWFDKIIPLPHPRWVMQYQRRNYDMHRDFICEKLGTQLA